MNEPGQEGSNWRRHLLWQVPLFLLVCFMVYFSSSHLDEELEKYIPEAVSNRSTHNVHESGYKAMFELCQKVGLPCRRFESPYRELPGRRAVLVVLAPNYPMTKFETEQVLAWVKKGNNLVYFDNCMYGSNTGLLEQIGVHASIGSSLEDLRFDLPASLPEAQHVGKLVLTAETRLVGGETVVSDERGALIVRVKYGKGRALVATVPGLCANRRISEKSNRGNFQFLVNWLRSGQGEILFDERVHGYTSSLNVFIYLARGPAGLVALQVFAIFLVALLSLNQRFGPPRLITVRRKIASSEFIDGMARTFKKARAYDAAFSILYGSFRARLCRALSCSPQEKVEEMARAWSQSTLISYDETFHFLQLSEELQAQRNCNEDRLLATMKECDRLYNESKAHLSVKRGRRMGG